MSVAVSKTLNELFDRINYKIEQMCSELNKTIDTEEIDLSECLELLENYYGSDWKNLAKFDDKKGYNKIMLNVGNKNSKFDAWLICWHKGADSGIHDHAQYGCIQKVLCGVLKETRYLQKKEKRRKKRTKGIKGEKEVEKEKKFEISEENKLRQGNVGYINNKAGYHKIENRSVTNDAVSLHIYAPPGYVTKYFDNNESK